MRDLGVELISAENLFNLHRLHLHTLFKSPFFVHSVQLPTARNRRRFFRLRTHVLFAPKKRNGAVAVPDASRYRSDLRLADNHNNPSLNLHILRRRVDRIHRAIRGL